MTVGHHVDISNLTEEECSKIINVISKDIVIRKSEKERATYLNKRFEELRREKLIVNSRRKKRYSFDDYCLICGKHLFTFCCFLHRGEECVSCEHYCCTSCREVLVVKDEQNTEQFYICNLCVNKRQLKYKTSEWFYELFQKRFKRFGSAKVLRAIYKQRKSIEPRVITLLALCRVLQPSRIHNIFTSKSSTTSISTSQDDNGVSYSSAYKQESFDEIVLETKSHRRRFLSESEVNNIKDTNLEIEKEIKIKDVLINSEEYYTSVDEASKLTGFVSLEDNEEKRACAKNETLLDEWISEGFEASGASLDEQTCLLENYEDSTPLLVLSIKKDEPIDRELDFNEDSTCTPKTKTDDSKLDYLGLVSLTLTICFILALVSCIGCVFEGEGEREQDENVTKPD